jgi:HPt (histidine-containing phosphotransfer) domain-containing protein
MPDHTESKLDVAVLHALVGDEPAVVAGLLSTYLDTLASASAQLGRALAARDTDGVHRAAHVMKSPSLCVGALALGRLCDALESAAREADWPRLDALAPGFEPTLASTKRAAQAHIDVLAPQVAA